MISVSKKDWSEKKVNQRLIDKISQDKNNKMPDKNIIVSPTINSL